MFVSVVVTSNIIKVYKKGKIGMKESRRKHFDKLKTFGDLLLSRDEDRSCCFSSPKRENVYLKFKWIKANSHVKYQQMLQLILNININIVGFQIIMAMTPSPQYQ